MQGEVIGVSGPVEGPMGFGHDGVDILLVEDDRADAVMIGEAFDQIGSSARIHYVSDGDKAARFLLQAGEYAAAPRPGLIILDLGLPRASGLEFLARIKADDDLGVIPVIVLSGSRRPADIRRCYALRANACILKPADFDGYSAVISEINAMFVNMVELPV